MMTAARETGPLLLLWAMAKPKRKRAARRESERETQKLARDLERIFSLEPGAKPERPIVIDSPSEVEVRARALPCPLCRGELRIEEHTAETIGSARLRVARMICAQCRAPRALYFQLASERLN